MIKSLHTLFTRQKLSVKKQTFFIKRLSFLLSSGLSTLDSIQTIKGQVQSKQELRIFDTLIDQLSNGQTLAVSMKANKGVFSNFVINIIGAGELSGTLNQNLFYLAEELQKKDTLRKKIFSALLYPLIILVFTLAIVLFLVGYIFPKISPIFKSLNAKLPVSTRTVMYVSGLVQNHGILIFLAFFIFGIISFYLIKKYSKLRLFVHKKILRLIIIGKIIRNFNLVNICRTLGLLLQSGISLQEALGSTTQATENLQYKLLLRRISRNVTQGKNISETILPVWAFDDMFRNMIAVGEKSGNLSEVLLYLAAFYENEFDDATKNLSIIIEPVLMIGMGLVVGFVAISIITPIYEITNNLKR